VSVEKMTSKALWSVVACKVVGDTIWGVSAAARTVGFTANTVANWVDCFGRTALMVESHYGKRYEDLTDRSLGVAAAAPGRHAMTAGETVEEPDGA
jgi:transposase-like protein